MPRPAKHDENGMLAAAASLVAAGGPAAATVAAIGQAVGAPSGSIYHRFGSRDALLGRLWLDKAAMFHERWARAFALADAREAAVQAALSLPRTAREDFDGARIMLLHRREDFLGGGWPAPMQAEAERLGTQIRDGMAELARRLFGRDDDAARQVTTFATLDVPFAAVRRHVGAGRRPPAALDALVETACLAVVDAPLPPAPRRGRGRGAARTGLLAMALGLALGLPTQRPASAQPAGVPAPVDASAPAPARRNVFGDPFVQATSAIAGCPEAEGPRWTDDEARAEAHIRAEKGTTCHFHGRCRLPNAYLYDREIVPRVVRFIGLERRFADSTLWVLGQRRVVHLKGCVARAEQARELADEVRRIDDVEAVVDETMVGTGGRPPYATPRP